jgi:hypothetical protein
MRTSRSISIFLLLGLLCAVPVLAQETAGATDRQILTSNGLDAAVASHVSAAERQRTELTEFLSKPAVQEVARDRGFDMARVEAAAAGLSEAELAKVAPLVAEPTATLQNGGTITISAIGVIIILLILILVT